VENQLQVCTNLNFFKDHSCKVWLHLTTYHSFNEKVNFEMQKFNNKKLLFFLFCIWLKRLLDSTAIICENYLPKSFHVKKYVMLKLWLKLQVTKVKLPILFFSKCLYCISQHKNDILLYFYFILCLSVVNMHMISAMSLWPLTFICYMLHVCDFNNIIAFKIYDYTFQRNYLLCFAGQIYRYATVETCIYSTQCENLKLKCI
jgi:hypothetical protein